MESADILVYTIDYFSPCKAYKSYTIIEMKILTLSYTQENKSVKVKEI